MVFMLLIAIDERIDDNNHFIKIQGGDEKTYYMELKNKYPRIASKSVDFIYNSLRRQFYYSLHTP